MLREGLEVLVGTPGRIVDCLQVSVYPRSPL
jgi:hypothetical protein